MLDLWGHSKRIAAGSLVRGFAQSLLQRNDKMKTLEEPHRIAICGESGLDVHRPNRYY